MALQAKQIAQQRLMLAPNITLALEVLRMPTMDLRAFLQQQAEENPFLEIDEADEDTTQEASSETEQEPELPDWEPSRVSDDNLREPDEEERSRDYALTKPQSLHESLLMQLGCQKLSAEERRLGELIIQHIDEDGYLSTPVEEIALAAVATLEAILAALALIQRFDPLGVGARDLRECLLLQLQPRDTGAQSADGALPRDSLEQLALRIVQDHFPLFVQHRLQALARLAGVSVDEVTEACRRLKQLNPKPGSVFSGDLPPSIIPDLVMVRREQYLDVELNEQELPHINVNRAYYRMLKDPRTPSEAKEFLVNKFRQTTWLIKAIDERNSTILSIARCLISLQREFVAQGPKALKPLTQAQVAQLVGRHPSTVSRAIAGKTIDTPYGIFRLEQFFASSIPQALENASVSDEAIKSEIQHLIAEEDAGHPLSDEALTKRLIQRNIAVARRTIAKYRTSLKILPAHLRKRRL
jgi:RNA polymerase sigma-54 factor